MNFIFKGLRVCNPPTPRSGKKSIFFLKLDHFLTLFVIKNPNNFFQKMIRLLLDKQIFASSDARFCRDTRNGGRYTQNFVRDIILDAEEWAFLTNNWRFSIYINKVAVCLSVCLYASKILLYEIANQILHLWGTPLKIFCLWVTLIQMLLHCWNKVAPWHHWSSNKQ